MWSNGFLTSFVLVLNLLLSANGKNKNIVCYYINSNGYSLAPPETLDATLCTHISYAFAIIDVNGFLQPQNKKLDIDSELYIRVTNLTAKNPSLQVLLSIGSVSAALFSSVAADKEKRANFVKSSRSYLETYNFHGIDIDWEKPTVNDSENFVALLNELRQEFDQVNLNWTLSVAVYPNPDNGYKVPEITKNVDMLNLMTYNYFGSWSAYTGQNAPLFESPIDSAYEKSKLNVAASIQSWINAGAIRAKINVGLPFYGRSFTLLSEAHHGLHAPILGAGSPATPTYRQICAEYGDWNTVWDDDQKNPYKYLGDQWVGYDDEESITRKVQYALSLELAGVMVWHIGNDDLKGECGDKQGLLKVINKKISGIF